MKHTWAIVSAGFWIVNFTINVATQNVPAAINALGGLVFCILLWARDQESEAAP